MPDFQAIPLMEDKYAVRTRPFEGQASSAVNIPGPVPVRGTGPAGVTQFGSSTVDAAAADGELDDEEIAALQDAATKGDAEASSFLEQLGIPLGIAAGVVGAGAGAYALRNALKNRYQGSDTLPDGSSKFINGADIPRTPGMYYPGEMTNIVPSGPAGDYIRPDPLQIGQQQRQALPAPNRQITDQRAGRFNQPGEGPLTQITDQRPKPAPPQPELPGYRNPPKTEPTGNTRVGQTLRKAAKAARRVR